MMRIKSVVLTTALVIMSFINSFGATDGEPDFAFPQTVAADATKALASATDGPTRLRALLELTCALQRIDPDTAFAMPALVRQNMEKPGLTDADRAMFTALEAKIISDIYNANRFKYNRVDAPLEPLPADISLWSGKQFNKRIADLYAEAGVYAEKDNAPLERYSNCLEVNEQAMRYIPDVRGFVALKNIDRFEPEEWTAKSSFAEATALLYPEASQPRMYWLTRSVRNDNDLLKLYKAHASEEAARYILYTLSKDRGRTYAFAMEEPADGEKAEDPDKALIKALEQSLRDFPDWYGNETLIYAIKYLKRASLDVYTSAYVAPGTDCEFTVKAKYAGKVNLTLYRLPYNVKIPDVNITRASKRLAVKSIYLGGVPDTTVKVSFHVDLPGKYALVPDIIGVKTDQISCVRFTATPFLPVAINGLEKQALVATDITTGAPLQNVNATLVMRKWRSYDTSKKRALGKTDRNGILHFNCEKENWQTQYLTFRYQNRNYDFGEGIEVSTLHEHGKVENTNILIFTDRTLYHPGDSIRWAAVLANNGKTLADAEVKITLRNTNSEVEGTATLRTDSYGRIEGSFATRKGILTGTWRLTAEYAGTSRGAYVMVSDFRLPTFTASITNVERDVPAKGCVRISGKATTFSGMPVINAAVKATINGATRWRWFAPARQLGTLEAHTDAGGNFTIDVPANMLATPGDEGKPYHDFYASVTVTSQDGEASDTSRGFTTGKPYTLFASAPKTVVDSTEPVVVKFEAYNADGKEAPIAIIWELMQKEGKNEKKCLEGNAKAGENVKIDISGLSAGYYNLRVSAADTTLADASQPLTLTVYNEAAGQMPADYKVFIPSREAKFAAGQADILVGVNAPQAYIYTVVRNGKELAQLDVRRLERGFHHLSIPVADPEDTQISLVTVYDGNVYNYGIGIKMPEVRLPEVKAESFRDHLSPGSGEQWRFRLVKGDGTPIKDAAMIATMYNKAIDELVNDNWTGAFSFYRPSYSFYLNFLRNYRAEIFMVQNIVNKSRGISFVWPEFRFLDNVFMTTGSVMNYRKSMAAAPLGSSNSLTARREHEDARTPGSILTGVFDNVEDVAVAEKAEEEEAKDEEDGGAAPEPKSETFEYRTGEALQAFWMPTLVADDNGNIDLAFTVPNANATWQMKAFAWDRDCTAARYMAQCIANKPVMVQPNLPRFLRQGDKATILATVFNNTDEQAVIASTIEIFDIATGATLQTAESTETVAAKGSAIISIDTEAPVDAASIGYRVRSRAGGFADGEQQIIPILSSATTVIESTEFYLNPNEKEAFEFTVKNTDNAILTLQYCQNPVWTAVKAMRGIMGNGSDISTVLAGKIFSTLAARKIIGDNKVIADVLRNWTANPSEKALVSMLEKNEDVKRLLLDQTPWVQTAANETQRMTALAEVLDPAKAKANLEASVAALEKLRNDDGGFAWGTWEKESSEWATESVLMTFGIAHSLGMLDTKLTKIVQPAFNYLVKEFLRRDYPRRDSINIGLSSIAAMMPFIKLNADAKAIIDRTNNFVASHWRGDGVGGKARDIIMLRKSHPEVVKDIMESIRQYGVYKPGTGLSFPSVKDIRSYADIMHAFKVMGAPAEEIDQMRQWVLVQAQATDDFGACNPDYIIAALMLSGSDWTSAPVEQNVKVNGMPVAIDKVESATGYFAQQIKAAGKKVNISVQPNGVTPSYGSVISISRKQMKNVKARAGRDISIEKRVLVQRDGQWVETNSFALGERVRVQLTIIAKRNLEYVTIDDERPASFEPVDQMPGFLWDGDLAFYREKLDASTRLFLGWLGKGTYHVSYDMTANVAGSFISGIATLQSQYAPELTAHSSAARITVK